MSKLIKKYNKPNLKSLAGITLASAFLLGLPASADTLTEPLSFGVGNDAKYYNWTAHSISNGNILTETIAKEAQVIINYNEADKSARLVNPTTSVDGTFVDLSLTDYSFGPAIYNSKNNTIDSIQGTFVGNNNIQINGTSYSGAIYNHQTNIGTINANFINNYTIGDDAIGGAIYNLYNNINQINGNFIGNYAFSNDEEFGEYYALGGAIRNYQGTISELDAYFEGNYVYALLNPTYGGAINNEFGTIENLRGTFINNYVYSEDAYWEGALGGAIANTAFRSNIKNISAYFKGNYAESKQIFASGGAILNDCTIEKIDKSTFIENYAKSKNDTAFGGAISNRKGGTINEIINSSFIGNYAISETKTATGGAIYTAENLTLTADNYNVEIQDNYTSSNGVIDDNAIYLDKNAKLTINLKNSGTLLLKDNINGSALSQTNFIGDGTGSLYLHSDIKTNTTTNNITINTIDDTIASYNFKSLTLAGDTNMVVDVDLKNAQMDRLTADSYGDHGDFKFNVIGMNMLSDAETDVTEIEFAQLGLKDSVVYGEVNYLIVIIKQFTHLSINTM